MTAGHIFISHASADDAFVRDLRAVPLPSPATRTMTGAVSTGSIGCFDRYFRSPW